jgi:hypothetical protein
MLPAFELLQKILRLGVERGLHSKGIEHRHGVGDLAGAPVIEGQAEGGLRPGWPGEPRGIEVPL